MREINVDNNMVGWYQSTVSGSYQVVEIIETFVNYLENLERCICIVYDTLAASSGGLGLKAIRLSDSFVKAFREGALLHRVCLISFPGTLGCLKADTNVLLSSMDIDEGGMDHLSSITLT